MRRGLMGWDPDELPKAALDARRGRLQAAMAREGLDALILYTNIVRPSAVCWLTAFTPYWIESLLLLLRDGETVLATALSKRVSDCVINPIWWRKMKAEIFFSGAKRAIILFEKRTGC